jgi:hypothetical protein
LGELMKLDTLSSLHALPRGRMEGQPSTLSNAASPSTLSHAAGWRIDPHKAGRQAAGRQAGREAVEGGGGWQGSDDGDGGGRGRLESGQGPVEAWPLLHLNRPGPM